MLAVRNQAGAACVRRLLRSTVQLSNLCVTCGDLRCETGTFRSAKFSGLLVEVAYMSEDGEYGTLRMPSKPRYGVISRTL